LLDVHFHSKFLNQIKFINFKAEHLQARCKGGESQMRLSSQKKKKRELSVKSHVIKYGPSIATRGGREKANPMHSEKTLSFQVFAFL